MTPLVPAGLRHVLAVCAHPDDETFGLGGVIGTLAALGVAVDLACLTRGEASTLGGSGAELSRTRGAELRAAAAVLGIRTVHQLEFPDGALDAVDLEVLASAVEPHAAGSDLLLVFDEGGITGHPDHCAATAAACLVAERLDLPVLAWAVERLVADALNEELGTGFVGRDPASIDMRLAVDRGRQLRAMDCHHSQLGGNPVPVRRIDLTGGCEPVRFLRSASTGRSPT